jgi:D-alanyl-D-alanine dipeptidase
VIPYADPDALIDDPQVLGVAIIDNVEPLVDLRTITALAVDRSRADVQQLSDDHASAQHRGAVDVILLQDGCAADMGWGFNQPGEGSRTAAPVTEGARRHRDILASAMDTASFINYPAEWWHWSYGDRYWAFQAGRSTALYGSL